MSGRAGHIKDVTQDDNDYRQFIINCYGNNDQRKYFSLAPFGIDFVAPENTRSLVSDSKNKDIQYNLGVLNKIRLIDLAAGECMIFSTDETGETLKSSITLRNSGNIEINKDLGSVDIRLNADGTMNLTAAGNVIIDVDGNVQVDATGDAIINTDGDVDVNASGNVTIDATQVNVNNGNLTVD